jgi:hypothetical protein
MDWPSTPQLDNARNRAVGYLIVPFYPVAAGFNRDQ